MLRVVEEAMEGDHIHRPPDGHVDDEVEVHLGPPYFNGVSEVDEVS